MEEQKSETAMHDDILHGASAIAKFLYGSPKHRRKVYNLRKAKQCSPPMFSMGMTICARKSEIIKWIEGQEKKVADYGRSA